MLLTKFSIKRQITLLMFYAIVLAFSFFAFTQLKIDFFPEIQFPIAGVITSYPGVGPKDIETTISRQLEEAISSVKNIKKVSSQSFTGTSIIILEFKYGTDMNQAEVDIRKNIDFVRDYMPKEASDPLVFVFDPSMSPIMFLSLSSQYLGQSELRKLSEDRIEPMLERISGVASVATIGGLQRQINVYMNPTLLSSFNISPSEVAFALQSGRGIQPGGSLKTDVKTYQLSLLSEYTDLDQIKKTTVGIRNGKPVYVENVADVVDGFKENSTEARADFGEGIMIIINKQSDANTVQTSDLVKKEIPNILKRLPQGTKLNAVWAQSDFITRSINNLRDSALIAFVLAFIIIYVFLLNIRGSIIMGLSMPISVLATFAVLYASNITLNIISMAGLALAIGMLVDNSIVVLENIFRHRELGKSRIESADIGASEVGMAITASTLTTVAVFLPVLFVPNITGQLFKDMVLTITFSLLVSLVVALTLVPMMASNILEIEKIKSNGWLNKLKTKIGNSINSLLKYYHKILLWSLRRKKTVLGIVGIAFIISIVLAVLAGAEFLPKTDQGFININIEAPAGNPIEKTRVIVYQLEDIVKKVIKPDELESASFMFGTREGIGAFGSTEGTIEAYIKLKPVNQRSRSQFEISDLIREKLNKIPGITYVFQEGGGFSTEKAIEVKVIGFDIDGGIKIAEQIKSRMQKIKGFVDIGLNIKETTPELQVNLNYNMLNSFHLSTLQVAANVSTAIQGTVVSRLREEGDEYDIRVQFAKEFRNKKESLYNIQIPLPTGGFTTLGEIADINEVEATPTIFRENQNRFVSVGAGLSGLELSRAISEVQKIIDSTPIPSEYQVIIGGSAEDQQEAFFYLGLAFVAAILLVYMIMAAQFESLVDPLIIMFTVPLSVIGVFPFLFITGTTLSVMALVGLIMLVGIAVNNGIVLVDYINQIKRGGLPLYDAVEQGSLARMRPVLMTALTTILGMVPLAIELGEGAETWSPLARAVIGGLTATTVLTLVVIPILYIIFERAGERVKAFLRKRKQA
ncbi:MAG: acriflavin resistance protein [Ignavibacteriales bacterium UTCHB2]|nr:MAG: Multidrug resistance protein MdtC [Ignavibacteria bacterium ADurb.Bin266]OQY69687.1 MAG: acriflavin resistance protein [Ignavibacteriales bacterium UTCHB2]HQI42091.1 efflux RND transporter permease subunit [Ignavibacteriaceae bacterium]